MHSLTFLFYKTIIIINRNVNIYLRYHYYLRSVISIKNIKVRTKLTIIVALVLVLVASESFISIQNMNQLKNKALDTMDTSSRQNYDDSIKEQVGVVISLLSEINNEYKAGRYSLDEAKKIAADEIHFIIYRRVTL